MQFCMSPNPNPHDWARTTICQANGTTADFGCLCLNKMMTTAVALGDAMDRQSSTRLISFFRYYLVLAGIAVIGVVPGASARVTTLTVNDSQPAF